tara:strand:+ start:321 stop:803 length:483 start_codon:yes stop_codon:yes gene_type:complete
MDTNKKRFVIVATCLISKFKDVQVAIAVDAEDAKKQWIKNNDRLGINVNARYGDKFEILDEETYLKISPQLIKIPNIRTSVSLSYGIKGNGKDNVEVVKITELTPAERRDVLDWLTDPASKADWEPSLETDGVPFAWLNGPHLNDSDGNPTVYKSDVYKS